MHITSTIVVLAAGSSMALADQELLPRLLAGRGGLLSGGGEPPGGGFAFGGAKLKLAAKPQQKAAAPQAASKATSKTTSNQIKPISNSQAYNAPKPVTPDPRDKQASDAADMADRIMTQYETKHRKSRKAQGVQNNDDFPPPTFSFNTGPVNTYNTMENINDNRGQVNNQRYAGGDMLSDGARKDASTNIQADNSINDNRQQAIGGSTISGGAVNAGRGGNKKSGMGNMKRALLSELLARSLNLNFEGILTARQSTDGISFTDSGSSTNANPSYDLKEDQAVVARDFFLLIELMRTDPVAKEEAMIELGNIPGLRAVIENLIGEYTSTNGQFTMNNFAALVEAMQDKTVERNVVDAFNSNYVYASIVEKLLIKYSQKTDWGADLQVEARGTEDEFANEYYLAARGFGFGIMSDAEWNDHF